MPPAPHVYVDESKARGMLLTAAALPANEIKAAQRALRSLQLPGQRRPAHFAGEGDRQRKKFLDGISTLAPVLRVYDGSRYPRRQQREACLRALVADAATDGTEMLVLERDERTLELDRRLLYRRVRELGCAERLRYEHLRYWRRSDIRLAYYSP